jgi:hypothetical protein
MEEVARERAMVEGRWRKGNAKLINTVVCFV